MEPPGAVTGCRATEAPPALTPRRSTGDAHRMPTLPAPSSLARPIVADGAMGTALFAAGMPVGEAPEAWLLTPEGVAAVQEVHCGHVAAGSRLILTSTFGANRLRLEGSEIPGRSDEVCRAAVAAARSAAARSAVARSAAARSAAGDTVIVAGSMGPTGGLLVPYGLLDPGEVRANYAQQAASLAAAGVDVLWIETMMDLNEALAAVDGAREGAPGLPIVATLVFAVRNRTMFGNPAEVAAAALVERGVAGIGANCGDGWAPVEAVIPILAAAAPGLHIVAKANAGIPFGTAEGETTYPGTPEEAAAYARRVADLGATIIGGCCGTTTDHVAAIAGALAG
jgi:methionine synthase I (cobalamin-dependent)